MRRRYEREHRYRFVILSGAGNHGRSRRISNIRGVSAEHDSYVGVSRTS